MSSPAWMVPARIVAWLVPYLLLVAGHHRLDAWLDARFRGRSRLGKASGVGQFSGLHEWRLTREPASARRISHSISFTTNILALFLALLSGAALPLAPKMRVGSWWLPVHLSGNASSVLLWVLALEWTSAVLLAFVEGGSSPLDNAIQRPGSRPIGSSISLLLLDVLPVTLITLSLVMTAGALDVRQEGCLRLTTLISLQGPDQAPPRWLAIRQPLAALLWIVSAAPLRPRSRARTSFAWQAHALNRALLASILLLGGWQGPYAGPADALAPAVWLGLAYTTIKAGVITSIWAWIWASLPTPAVVLGSRVVWRMLVPAAAVNLVLTSVIVVTR